MGIKEDYAKVTDTFGLVQVDGGTSGNGPLYTAEAVVAFNDNCELGVVERNNLSNTLNACQLEPGLMLKAPAGKTDQESPDDYFGFGLASCYVDNGALASRIVAYGKQGCSKYKLEYEDEGILRCILSPILYYVLSLGGFRKIKYVYNNVNPGYFTLSSWMGRFPALIAHLKLAAYPQTKEDPSVFEFACLLLGLTFVFGGTDPWIMSWCQSRVLSDRFRFFDSKLGRSTAIRIISFWRKRFTKKWGSMGKLMGVYFKKSNPSHPSITYLEYS